MRWNGIKTVSKQFWNCFVSVSFQRAHSFTEVRGFSDRCQFAARRYVDDGCAMNFTARDWKPRLRSAVVLCRRAEGDGGAPWPACGRQRNRQLLLQGVWKSGPRGLLEKGRATGDGRPTAILNAEHATWLGASNRAGQNGQRRQRRHWVCRGQRDWRPGDRDCTTQHLPRGPRCDSLLLIRLTVFLTFFLQF